MLVIGLFPIVGAHVVLPIRVSSSCVWFQKALKIKIISVVRAHVVLPIRVSSSCVWFQMTLKIKIIPIVWAHGVCFPSETSNMVQ